VESIAGSALEVATDDSNHHPSSQRRYRLDPPLTTNSGNHHDVVVVPGANATYAFSGVGESPEVAALLTHPHGDGDAAAVLAKLGYRIVERAGVQRP